MSPGSTIFGVNGFKNRVTKALPSLSSINVRSGPDASFIPSLGECDVSSVPSGPTDDPGLTGQF